MQYKSIYHINQLQAKFYPIQSIFKISCSGARKRAKTPMTLNEFDKIYIRQKIQYQNSSKIFPFIMMNDPISEKELLKQQFELISANIKGILNKRREKISSYDRDFILNAIKKVAFVKNSFDIKSPNFSQIIKGIGLETHPKNAIVFEKGDEGNHFYIVLQGVYCVEVDSGKDGKKQRQIYYYPGDSFGQVSLIYDVPRGTRIVADKSSSLLTIKKEIFNQIGDLRKNILLLNSYFTSHPYFENQSSFMIRVVSSISKLSKFGENQIIIDEGAMFNQIFFFVKGQAKVYRTLNFQNQHGVYTETIQIETLVEGSVYGQHFYTNKTPSTIRILGTSRGEFIRVSFKDDVHTIQNALYKRIRHNSLRFPTDEELLSQFKLYLSQKLRQLQYICTIYKDCHDKKLQLAAIKRKIAKLSDSKLVQK